MTTNKFNIGEVLEVVEGTEDMNFTWYPVGTHVTVIGRSEYTREDSDSEPSYIVSKEGTQQYLRPSQLKRIEKKTPKWFVKIEETLTYNLEVEAATQQEAEDAAFNHQEYVNNNCDEHDAYVADIHRKWEPVAKDEGFRYCITSDTEGRVDVQEKESSKIVASFYSVEDAMAFIRYKEGR